MNEVEEVQKAKEYETLFKHGGVSVVRSAMTGAIHVEHADAEGKIISAVVVRPDVPAAAEIEGVVRGGKSKPVIAASKLADIADVGPAQEDGVLRTVAQPDKVQKRIQQKARRSTQQTLDAVGFSSSGGQKPELGVVDKKVADPEQGALEVSVAEPKKVDQFVDQYDRVHEEIRLAKEKYDKEQKEIAERVKAAKNELAADGTFPKIIPPKVLHADLSGKKHYVLDHGDRISVTNRAMTGLSAKAKENRQQSIAVALKAAKERFGEPVRFHGSTAFEKEIIAAAIYSGVKLEPATSHGYMVYKDALERCNTLTAPQHTQRTSVDTGRGLSL